MPLFSSSSGVQINGGNFYDIGGDLNLESAHVAAQNLQTLTALEFGWNEDSRRQLMGAERTERRRGSTRMLPYNISRRPQFASPSHYPSPAEDHALSASALLPEPIQHGFSQRDPELHPPSFTALGGNVSGSQYLSPAHPTS
ncbi:hypothetical protein B0H11DRAFT_2294626, partial [Mycena galericulata]